MDAERNGAQLAQQAAGVVTQSIAEQERKAQKRADTVKQLGKQQVWNKAKSELTPVGKKLLEDKLHKMPKPLQKLTKVGLEVHSKGLGALSKMMPKTKMGAKVGAKLLEQSKKAKAMAKVAGEVSKTVAKKTATKAVAAASAGVTLGASLAVEQGLNLAQKAKEGMGKIRDAKMAKDVVSDVGESKDAMKETADKAVSGKITEQVNNVVPGADKVGKFVKGGNDKSDDKNKDNNMAIFKGTKDLADKTGISKDLDFTR